jgi:ribosome recycling factor
MAEKRKKIILTAKQMLEKWKIWVRRIGDKISQWWHKDLCDIKKNKIKSMEFFRDWLTLESQV